MRVWVPDYVPTDSFVNNWRRPGQRRLVGGRWPDYCRVHCCFVLLCPRLSQYISFGVGLVIIVLRNSTTHSTYCV